MDEIQQAIQEILGNPEKLAELRAVAENLGLGAEMQKDDSEEASAPTTAPLSAAEPRQEALLQALLPYLNPARQKRLERALRVARISRIAGAALQNYGNLFEAGVI